MYNSKFLYTTLFLCLVLLLSAQETWTLEQCIQQAIQQHLPLQSADLQIQQAALNCQEQRASRLPQASVGSRLGLQLGRTVDPTTNTFDNQSISYNLWQMNASMPIYQGGRMKHSIRQSEYLITAAQADKAQVELDIKVQTTALYLEILLAKEGLHLALQNLGGTAQQVEQITQLVQAGLQPQNQLTNLEAQQARQEQARVQAHNQLEQAYLNLYHFLGLPMNKNIKIAATVEEIAIQQQWDRAEVQNLIERSPALQAAQARQVANGLTANILQADRLPNVSLSIGLNSNFSSAAQRVTSVTEVPYAQAVMLQGNEVTLEGTQQVPVLDNNPYFNQIKENFGQVVELNISYPLYDGGRYQRRMEKAQLEQLQSHLQVETAIRNARHILRRLLTDIAAASQNYEATQASVTAAQTAYQQVKEAVRLGVATHFDLQTAQLQLEVAENSRLQAKYQRLFQYKLATIYQQL